MAKIFVILNPGLVLSVAFVLSLTVAFGLVIYPLASGKPLTPYLTAAGGVYAAAVAALFAITKGGF